MEDIKIALPVSKKEATIRGFINGRDSLAFKSVIFEGLEIGDQDDKDNIKMDTAKIQKGYDALMQSLLKTVGDSTSNAYETLLDLPQEDYEAVFVAVTKLYSTSKDEAEKKG